MRVSSNVRAAARVLSVLALASGLSGAAQSSPLIHLGAFVPAESALITRPAPPKTRGPFGLADTTNIYSARWQNLQPLLRIEAKIVEMCRAAASGCPAAAAKFIAVVDAGRKLQGRARIGEINRAVNLAIRPASDLAQYGVIELWASPLTTFASGAGDCEDYAIAKYVALREAGVPERDLRLLVVRLGNDDHAVVSARVDGEWLILDNRNMRLLTEADSGLEALYALGGAPNSVPSMTEAPATAAAPGLDWPQSFAVELSV